MRTLLLLLALGGVSVQTTAAEPESIEARLDRVERLLESQSLVEMMARLDALQREVQQLRGEVEEQNHTIEGLKQRQRELYLDIDRRLSRMEREGPAAIPPGSPAAAMPPGDGAGLAPAAAHASNSDAPAAAADAGNAEAERQAYQEAFDMLRELRYAQAITAFRQFLKDYPNGKYAHIAQYWLGEANYARRDFKQAINDYQHLIVEYPRSPKLAEAMLKIGYSHYELGDMNAARQVLGELVGMYPDTTEAGQAKALLKQIK